MFPLLSFPETNERNQTKHIKMLSINQKGNKTKLQIKMSSGNQTNVIVSVS